MEDRAASQFPPGVHGHDASTRWTGAQSHPLRGNERPARAGAERVLARRLSGAYLSHDVALAALAFAFDGSDPRALLARLDDAALALFGVDDQTLQGRAHVLAGVMSDELGLRIELGGHGSLLLGQAFSTGRADPLVLAAVAHELARRAGFESFVARRDGDDFWTILTDGDYFLPLGYMRPPDDRLVSELHACCPHELACSALELLGARAPADAADMALRVRAMLPLVPKHEEEPGA